MPTAEFRLFFNNQGADADLLDRFSEVQVDQAIGMAAEAELRMDMAAGADGTWTDVEEDFAQPLQRVRVEVKIGSAPFTPLIEGRIVQQKFEFSATPDRSTLTLLAQDDSTLLNQEEAVELFEDTTPDQIARSLIEAAGMQAETIAVADAGSAFTRYTVRRGTAMLFLRELARRHGMFMFVRPGEQPGQSIGVFTKLNLAASDLPELLLMGADRNVNQLSVEFDALRPVTADASTLRISDKGAATLGASSSSEPPLGDTAVHTLVEPGHVLLTHTREESSDLSAATQAAVDSSSWAYVARGETTADIYSGILQPYNIVRVSGLGGFLSGDYLISRVTHLLSSESYRQRFTLVRNARLSGAPSPAGGAGVF